MLGGRKRLVVENIRGFGGKRSDFEPSTSSFADFKMANRRF